VPRLSKTTNFHPNQFTPTSSPQHVAHHHIISTHATTMPPKFSSTTTARKPALSSPLKNTYLLAYNALSAALWAGVLYKTVTVGAREINVASKSGWITAGAGPLGAVKKGLSSGKVYDELETYTRLTQSLAGLEVLHSLLGTCSAKKGASLHQMEMLTISTGVVRAPLLTTLMQVSSRFLLVHLIAHPFPSSTRTSPAYATMLLAWSITEVVRYTFFVFSLSGVGVPRLWTWLRYNTFVVLYPLGVASECWLVWKAVGPASRVNEMYGWVLYAILAVYVPGIWVLFTHMLAQRRKVMKDARRSL
jgi:very-long-chain (3R)-3-hydroxyacyl-CoA dehydratase